MKQSGVMRSPAACPAVRAGGRPAAKCSGHGAADTVSGQPSSNAASHIARIFQRALLPRRPAITLDPAPIRFACTDSVAVITMDAPERRNVLSAGTLKALVQAFARAAAEGARATILRAGPDNAVWCAGFDIAALERGRDPLAESGPLQALFAAIAAHPAPVIAMLHGTAWGGGTDLALRCDLIIADPTATLAFTPAKLGLPYDPEGLLNVMQRAGLAVAVEMFATGDPIGADRARAVGLVSHVVPETEIEPFTLAMARRIAVNAPLSVTSAKRQLRALNTALIASAELRHALQAMRVQALDSDDYAEGIAAFRAKRSPAFRSR